MDRTTGITERLAQIARPWSKLEDIDALMDRIGDAQYVLLGEASHGTSEFYIWRSHISRRLMQEKGFNFIAVEGDWPDCYRVNRYVKGYENSGKSASEVMRTFNRWPTWMWGNREMLPLVEWMRRYNAEVKPPKPVGFYGLDVYSLWDSLRAVTRYLEMVDPEAAERAKEAYRCFDPYGAEAQQYSLETMFAPESCEDEVVQVLQELRQKAKEYPQDDEAIFDAEQNALVAVNAERYYRTLIMADSSSWNIRDRHMTETLTNLMRRHGDGAKAIIWAHNTHIGDARFTDMAAAGMINLGQLLREQHTPDNVVLVGFGSYGGTVVAGANWDAPVQVMRLPSARMDSWEHLLHEAGPNDKLLISNDMGRQDGLWEVRNHRAVGVVYHPERDRLSNYVPTLLPARYDAFIYLDETHALRPLQLISGQDKDLPETYPWRE